MGDATEDIGGNLEEETEDTYAQVLDEVGLEMVGGQAVPTTKLKGKEAEKSTISNLEQKISDLKS